MLENLLTEQANPASEAIDSLSVNEMLEVINAEDEKVAPAVRAQIPKIAAAVEAIVGAMDRGGRLFYIGAGTSGRLGVLDAAECPPTFSVPPSLVQGMIAGGEAALARATEATEDDPVAGRRDLLEHGFSHADVVVGITASGRTPYVLGAIGAARELGARTIGLCCTLDSPLSQVVEIAIEVLTGPEVIAGSTRMKAGTATKLTLNMISTAVMIRRGFVYGNRMVNVQPRNTKLLDRARRIVSETVSVSYEAGSELLEQAEGSVRTAIIMGKLGVGRAVAEEKLAAGGGRIGEALKGSHG